MGKFSRLGNDLYSGRKSIDFVGRIWLWYAISGLIVIAAILGLSLKGLNLGIDFKGGTEYTVVVPHSQVTQANADKLRSVVEDTGIPEASAPEVTTSGSNSILVTVEEMSADQSAKVITAIANSMHIEKSAVNPNSVGASFGSQIAKKALTGLIVFLVLVVLFIWAYFREWKMSVGALVALAHDIVISAGIYALSGFQVSPATVTGFLTILGFSLYDTVVVFDKVRENTKTTKSSRRTYSELANLAVNQTLVRSINTSFVALLPVLAILLVTVFYLGAGDLQDLSLALFVGMASGTYSSIFIATPLVAQLKSREKAISEQDRRARARQRRDADRYANVPSFRDDMGVDRATLEGDPEELREELGDDPDEPSGYTPTTPRRPEATGSGRTVPDAKGPVRESRAAGRQQPARQPRSKRRK
jgi:preprotein translocase subunit SecF